MKKYIAFILFLILISFQTVFAQSSNELESDSKSEQEFVDTLGKNLVGINVFPAFGMMGGGMLPNSKIYFQYKRYFDKTNIKFNLNFIDYYRPNDKTDYLGFTHDTVKVIITDPDTGIESEETQIADSMLMRRFTNDVYSYDVRFGIERAFRQKDMRLHFGVSAIFGYQFVGETYYHYKRPYNDDVIERVNLMLNPVEKGYSRDQFLKMGLDLSVGVDIFITENIIFTIQYSPELAYFSKFKQELLDPDNYYLKHTDEKIVFTPDYIDFVINIRF